MKKLISTSVMIAVVTTLVFSQNHTQKVRGTGNGTVSSYKFSVSTTYLTFDNFGPEETNVHMYEFHFGYRNQFLKIK